MSARAGATLAIAFVLAGACSGRTLLDPPPGSGVAGVGGGGSGLAPTGVAGSAVAGAAGMVAPGAAGTNATGGAGTGSAGAFPSTGINAQLPGPGCGKPLPAGQMPGVPNSPKGYFHYTVQGTGKTLGADQPAKVGPRTFWVRVPPDYDEHRPYRVVYIGQGCGSFNSANIEAYPLFKETLGGTEQAIYVAMDIPTDNANMNCYDNRDGPQSQEWEAFELFHTVVDSNYCADNNRIYIAGYSTGAWLANMWGCYFAGDGLNPAGTPGVPRKFAPKYHIRAQATYTGGEPANNPPCNGKVAALWIHDAGDNGNPISGSIAALARVGRMNGCDTTYDKASVQVPWHAEVPVIRDFCKRFTTCPTDYPVVFCTTIGLGHTDQNDRAIAAFKLFFDELDPPLVTASTPPVPDPGTTGAAGSGGGADAGPLPACFVTNDAGSTQNAKLTAHDFCTNLLATCTPDVAGPPPPAYATEAACEASYMASPKQHCQSYHLCGNAFGKTATERRTHCPHAWAMGPCAP